MMKVFAARCRQVVLQTDELLAMIQVIAPSSMVFYLSKVNSIEQCSSLTEEEMER